MRGVVLSRRAERDLRGIGPGADLKRPRVALEGFAGGAANMDVKPPAGVGPWLRLRVGDYRVLYRAVDPAEAADSDA
jgi:mRNA-degrading endonuclease RelE of RelBE toxin-antitoxin system